MHTKTKLLREICHLFQGIARCGATIDALSGAAREQLRHEWRDLTDTLNSKMKEAKYFRHQELVFIKYLNIANIEVVCAPGGLSIEVFNSRWMDTICQSVIIDEQEYLAAVSEVLVEKGGLYVG